jgi:hypothetical protein
MTKLSKLFIGISNLFVFKNRDNDLNFEELLGRLMDVDTPGITGAHNTTTC